MLRLTAPVRRMLLSVNGLNNDLFAGDAELDRVRETPKGRSPSFLVRTLKRHRIRADAGHKRVHGQGELPTKPLAPGFVPPAHLQNFGFRFLPLEAEKRPAESRLIQ